MAKKAHATEEIPCSDQPAIRLFNPYYAGNDVGGNPFNFAEIARLAAKVFYRGAWAACTMETAACFSAIGYYFAKEVHAALGVPVGSDRRRCRRQPR